ncbi:hypothetical protein HYU17_04915 [Candidatus Woesearchaeota archaeon]|nr:hypothetical protein [Candidatus Woesearchaeota archaeon]
MRAGPAIGPTIFPVVPAAALNWLFDTFTLYGPETLHGSDRVVALVFPPAKSSPAVGIAKPFADVPPNSLVLRIAEYSPESLATLDALLSDPNDGSALYMKAKRLIFNTDAPDQRNARTAALPSGKKVTVHGYRPWLSEWLIRGLAELGEDRLSEAGIMAGQQLEQRLRYESGEDFSSKQYSIMATLLEELLISSNMESNTILADHSTLRGYLNGKTRVPKSGRWELLKVLAAVNPKIMKAFESRNREQFMGNEGFYWAVRVFDTLRSFLRKRYVCFNGKDHTTADPDRAEWDHVPVVDAIRLLTRDRIIPIDNHFDAVRIADRRQAINNNCSNRNGHVLANQPGKRRGIYASGKFPDLPAPNVVLKNPRELYIDMILLYNIFNSMVLIYAGKTGQEIPLDSIDYPLSPTPAVAERFAPKTRAVRKDVVHSAVRQRFDTAEIKQVRGLEQRIIASIESGDFDRTLEMPEKTTMKLLRLIRGISDQTPPELFEYAALNCQAAELEGRLSYSSASGISARDKALIAEYLGLPNTSLKTVRSLLESVKDRMKKMAKCYQQKYGDTLSGFFGVVLSPDAKDFSGNGNRPFMRHVPTLEHYKQMLAQYGAGELLPFAKYALPIKEDAAPPELIAAFGNPKRQPMPVMVVER